MSVILPNSHSNRENEFDFENANSEMSGETTVHINARRGDFAKTVLMPGDPLRAKSIVETYLTDVTLVNEVRGMLGYTGKYKGKPVSVMGGGMGSPSMGIYSHELFNFYDVDNIIRIGTAGAISDSLKLRDIVVAMGCCTDSNYISQFNLSGSFAPIASYYLLDGAVQAAKRKNVDIHIGNILSSDIFYSVNMEPLKRWRSMGVMAVEMESAALYINAAVARKNAICICTISNNIFTNESCSAKERQTSFNGMAELALEMI
jgi:purine-nucleoside phosphorylase